MDFYSPDATEVAEVNEELRHNAEVESLRTQVADHLATIESLRARVTELLYSRQRFERRVVEVAQDVARSQGWCRAGLREALERLDLEPDPESWSGTVTVSISFSGLEASDRDEAIEQIDGAISEARVYGLNVDDVGVSDYDIYPDED